MDLPAPGDPLVHSFGSITMPTRVENDTALTDARTETREIIPRFSKYQPVREIHVDKNPEKDTRQQVAIAAVIGLRLMGLSIIDIAGMFNVHSDEITKICNSSPAQGSFERMYKAMINSNADNVQGRIASYAHKAIDTIIGLMDGEKVPDIVKLKAGQDILDRSGANAEQFFAAKDDNSGLGDELRIVMMDEEGEHEKISVTLKRK